VAVQINIRDVPERVRDELAARAALQGKSMQEYLRAELERLTARPGEGPERRRQPHRAEPLASFRVELPNRFQRSAGPGQGDGREAAHHHAEHEEEAHGGNASRACEAHGVSSLTG